MSPNKNPHHAQEQLAPLRDAIDTIDAEMLTLFEKRMHVVENVRQMKQKYQLPTLVPQREQEILQKNLNKLSDSSLALYYEQFQKAVMTISRAYQADQNEKEGQ